MRDPRSFQHTIAVRTEDLDELGHVNNVVYLRYIEDVARAHADSAGMTFEVMRQIGALPVVRRHDVTYLGPARAGERLEVATRLEQAGPMRWVRHNTVSRDGQLLVRGQTEWVWIDVRTERPVAAPTAIREAFGF